MKIIKNKVTSRVTKPVTLRTYRRVLELLDLAVNTPNCVGLAANQVRRGLCRMKLRFFVYNFNNTWIIIMNPKIIHRTGYRYEPRETCLTWPERSYKVRRYSKIVIEYTDRDFQKQVKSVGGKEAQIIQHEMDHLDGVQGRPPKTE